MKQNHEENQSNNQLEAKRQQNEEKSSVAERYSDYNNEEAFLVAAKTNDIDALRYFAEKVDINIKNAILHYAVENDNIEMTQMLVKLGGNVNIQNNYGSTPLHDAATKGNLEIAEILTSALQAAPELDLVQDKPENTFLPQQQRANERSKNSVKLDASKNAAEEQPAFRFG